MNIKIDISEIVFRTERLTLRPFCQADLDDLYNCASVDGVGQMAGWKPHESKEESQVILDLFVYGRKNFALEYCGKVIGSLGIEQYDEARFPEFEDKKCCEIGFVLAKEYWGKGLMPEALNEVIRFLFEEMGLDLILCGYFLWNERSRRVQEKCGFKYYQSGMRKTSTGTIEEEAFNILTKEDWRSDHRC